MPTHNQSGAKIPAVAIVAAVVAVEAAVTATTIFSVITAVGAVTSAVGAITGNEKLMKIGAVVGLAGAVGGFASSSGLFGDAMADLATPASNVSGDIANEFSSNVVDGVANTPLAESAADAGGMVAQNTPTPPMDTGMVGATAPTVDPTAAAAPTAPNPVAATDVPNPTDSLQPAPIPEPDYSQVKSDIGSTFNVDMAANQVAPAGAYDKLMSGFSKLGQFTKDNKDLMSMITGGIASAADPSARNLREAQAASLNANAAQTKKITSNMSAMPTIDWNKTFNPSGTVKRPGMIGG